MKSDLIVNKFRADHKEELDNTLKFLIGLRDDVSQKARDRIDAGRSIARMLGGLAPEKEEDKKPVLKKPEIKTAVENGLEDLIARL